MSIKRIIVIIFEAAATISTIIGCLLIYGIVGEATVNPAFTSGQMLRDVTKCLWCFVPLFVVCMFGGFCED